MDPKYSMWLSADPAIGEYMGKTDAGMGGIYNHVNFNLYHYAGNNPIRYTDPDGRETGHGTPYLYNHGMSPQTEKFLIDREYDNWLISLRPQDKLSTSILVRQGTCHEWSEFYRIISSNLSSQNKNDTSLQVSNAINGAEIGLGTTNIIPNPVSPLITLICEISKYALSANQRTREKIRSQLDEFNHRIEKYLHTENNQTYDIQITVNTIQDRVSGKKYFSLKADIYKDGEIYKTEYGIIYTD